MLFFGWNLLLVISKNILPKHFQDMWLLLKMDCLISVLLHFMLSDNSVCTQYPIWVLDGYSWWAAAQASEIFKCPVGPVRVFGAHQRVRHLQVSFTLTISYFPTRFWILENTWAVMGQINDIWSEPKSWKTLSWLERNKFPAVFSGTPHDIQ